MMICEKSLALAPAGGGYKFHFEEISYHPVVGANKGGRGAQYCGGQTSEVETFYKLTVTWLDFGTAVLLAAARRPGRICK